jgi:Ca-activated chloride channel family protein
MHKLILWLLLSGFLMADILDFKTIDNAKRAYEQGDFKQSEALFNKLDLEDPTLIYNRANVAYKAGEYEKALRLYQQAKGVDEARRLHNMGNVYFQQKHWQEAIAHYTKALQLRNDEDTRFNLALAQKKKREQEAKKKQEKQKKKKPKKKQQKKKEQKRKNDKKKKNDKKRSDKKEDNKKNPKQNDAKKQQEKRKSNMTPQQRRDEAMRKKELNHMLKALQKKKMPTMIYPTNEAKGAGNEENPW